MSDRRFGHISGIAIGTPFRDRSELSKAGVHRPTQAGISGGQYDGADSIVVSGGYEDDIDEGDEIIYTGHGGNDPNTRKQVADQTLTAGNLALAKSCTEGLPVRVIRGEDGDRRYSPQSGYRYDGLYYVESYWHERGRSGFRIWRYRLLREPTSIAQQSSVSVPDAVEAPVTRITVEVQRQVRNTATVQFVKQAHNYTCQVCGERIVTTAGPYAEGAHIRPLGRPHDGPDVPENILCLCPNDHVRFDYGALLILDNLQIVDAAGNTVGTLRTAARHAVSRQHLAYHRERFAGD